METWLIYALLSTFFGSLTSVIAKFGLKDMSAEAALVVRTSMVLGMVLINFFIFNDARDITSVPLRATGFLLLSGVTTSFSWIFYYNAIKEGPVSMIATIDKGSIIITLLLSFIILKEPLTLKLLIGAAFILTGLLILVWK